MLIAFAQIASLTQTKFRTKLIEWYDKGITCTRSSSSRDVVLISQFKCLPTFWPKFTTTFQTRKRSIIPIISYDYVKHKSIAGSIRNLDE